MTVKSPAHQHESHRRFVLSSVEKRRLALTCTAILLSLVFLPTRVATPRGLYLWIPLVVSIQPMLLAAARLHDNQARARIGRRVEVAMGATWGLITFMALPVDPTWQALEAASLVPVLMTGVSTTSSPVKTPFTFGAPLCLFGGLGVLAQATGAGKAGALVLLIAWLLTVVFHREVRATVSELSEALAANTNLVRGLAAEHERLERANVRLEQANNQLDRLARTDSLTGVANRLMFTEQLVSSLEQLNNGKAANVGLAYLDLDGFKEVNDCFGHRAGDQLLIAVTERLRARAEQRGHLLARLGGDELVLLGSDVDANELGQQLLEAFSMPFSVDGRHLSIASSIGVVVVHTGIDPEAMLRLADTALYRAKDRGGGVLEIFGPESAVDGNHDGDRSASSLP